MIWKTYRELGYHLDVCYIQNCTHWHPLCLKFCKIYFFLFRIIIILIIKIFLILKDSSIKLSHNFSVSFFQGTRIHTYIFLIFLFQIIINIFLVCQMLITAYILKFIAPLYAWFRKFRICYINYNKHWNSFSYKTYFILWRRWKYCCSLIVIPNECTSFFGGG